MSAKQSSFILYHDMWDQLKELSNEERGKILEAIFIYHSSGEIIQMDRMLNIIFISIRSMLDRDRDKYEEYIEKQSENGRKGGRPKKAIAFEENPENPTVFGETHGNPIKAKKADSDSVSVSPSESLSDSASDRDIVSCETKITQSEYDLAILFLETQAKKINNGSFLDYPDFIQEEYREEWWNFLLYWTEPTKTGKVRARLEKSFEIKRRFTTWIARSKQFSKSSPNQKTVGKL